MTWVPAHLVQAATFQPAITPKENTSEAKHQYWSRYKNPVVLKEPVAVPSLSLSGTGSSTVMAVCSGDQVHIYSVSPLQLKRSLSVTPRSGDRRDTAASFSKAVFRQDGLVLALGDTCGGIHIYDTVRYRLLKYHPSLHRSTIRDIVFNPQDPIAFITVSDDKALKCLRLDQSFDSGLILSHPDQVRSVTCHPTMSNLFISGCYDHNIRLWDTASSSPVATMDHGAPVESVLFYGTYAISAGGSEICIWDLFKGGSQVRRWSLFQKTVTCMALSEDGQFLLVGSLDRCIKILTLNESTPKIVHTFSVQDPVLSLAVTPCALVTGLLSGFVSVRTADRTPPVTDGPDLPDDCISAPVDKRPSLKAYDKYIKQFQYRKALDAALEHGSILVVSAVLEALKDRSDGLERALYRPKDPDSLLPLFSILERYILDNRFRSILSLTLDKLLWVLSEDPGILGTYAPHFARIRSLLDNEMNTQREAVSMLGTLDCLSAWQDRMKIDLAGHE